MNRRSFFSTAFSLAALGSVTRVLSACARGESASPTTAGSALLAGRSFELRRDPG